MATGSQWRTEAVRGRLRRLVRHPLTHFAAAGTLLFALDRAWQPSAATSAAETIVVSPREIERARREWIAQHGAVRAQDEERIIERTVEEEILDREALRLSLDRGDRLVRDRLVKLGRFLGVGAGSDDDIEGEARALRLEREDPVIRRYLAHLVEIALAGAPEPPRDDEVRRRYEDLVANGKPARRYRFAHVYLGRDSHGADLEAEARDLLVQLRAHEIGPDAAATFGDPFATGSQIGPAPASDLARGFGPEFAAAVAAAPSGLWWGPLRSSYGLHLVWMRERLPGQAPAFEAVRNKLAWDLVHERQEQRRRDGLRRLRSLYRVEIAGG